MTSVDVRRKAVIFDMDDTLYPERRFALSGFAAVADALGARPEIDGREAFRLLVGAIRRGRRRTALQLLCQRYGLPQSMVHELVDVIRAHAPRLRLPRRTRQVLTALRPAWRLGVLTNGVPAIQARKVRALGLASMVDHVVFAAEHGTGRGKPEIAPFLAITRRLAVDPARCVFVGDDPDCDIGGAKRAGMCSVHLRSPARCQHASSGGHTPDSSIASLYELPHVAGALLEERCRYGHHDRTPPYRS